MQTSTLESRYHDRVQTFASTRTSLERELDDAIQLDDATSADAIQSIRARLRENDEEEVAYILETAPYIKEYTTDTMERRTAMDGYATITSKCDQNSIYQKYLMMVEHDVSVDLSRCLEMEDDEYVCTTDGCGAAMLHDSRQSMMVCPSCSAARSYVGLSEANLSYEEEISQQTVSNFSYKRANHFSEWLMSIQAKESTDIDPAVIDAIRAEFKKTRASTRKDITPAKVRQFMKKLNLNKLYEHAHYVCTLINGIPPPRLDLDLENMLKRMFMMIQEPFERAIRGTPRKNFLSYSYTLHKFCELLDRRELLCHFALLKSTEKLFQQDKIWEKICRDVGWPFMPSV